MLLLVFLFNHSVQASDRTFNNYCSDCHTGGFKGWMSGAPNVESKDQWKKFLERDSLEQMKTIVLNGSDDHKVKGGCRKCSNVDVIDAIDYMMSLVK